MDGRTDDGQKVIFISHPKHSSGEQKKKQLEMCPQYTDAPALGTSVKLCKPCKLAYVSAGASVFFGHISS